jgi:hypothetical protein
MHCTSLPLERQYTYPNLATTNVQRTKVRIPDRHIEHIKHCVEHSKSYRTHCLASTRLNNFLATVHAEPNIRSMFTYQKFAITQGQAHISYEVRKHAFQSQTYHTCPPSSTMPANSYSFKGWWRVHHDVHEFEAEHDDI